MSTCDRLARRRFGAGAGGTAAETANRPQLGLQRGLEYRKNGILEIVGQVPPPEPELRRKIAEARSVCQYKY
jgi:hypothetical protein